MDDIFTKTARRRETKEARHDRWQRDKAKLKEKLEDDPQYWATKILAQLRYRAKKKGLGFDITAEDIPVPEYCPVLGIRLILGVDKDDLRDSPSVDRINNDLGYIKGNVMVISVRANELKSDATIEELEAVLNYIREQHGKRDPNPDPT